MRALTKLFPAAMAAALLAAGAAPAGPYDDLLRRVPEHANAVLFANVRALQSSPYGVNHSWARKLESDYQGGLTDLPPVAERVVIAQQLDPTSLQPAWRIELVQLGQEIKPDDVARREGGTKDAVRGVPVVASPRGCFFVFVAPRVVAEACPPDRQKLGRWLQFCEKSSRPVVSEYLRDAGEAAALGAQAVFAVDLKDMFDQPGVERRLKGLKCLEGKRVDLPALARTLAGVEGLQIKVRAADDLTGEVRLDFAGPADALKPFAKEFLLQVMEAMGAAVDDLDAWQAHVEGKSVVLSGALTERGARLLLSPAINRVTGPAYADMQKLETAPPDPKAGASLRYYRSVTGLLSELRTQKPTRKVADRAYWYQQYAGKIDSLPMLNVDEELVQFGVAVSKTLRGLANLGKAAQNQNTQINAQLVDTVATGLGYYPGGYGYGYGAYGAYGYGYGVYAPYQVSYDNYNQIASLTARVGATEKAIRDQTWANIEDATTAVRRKMVEKYKIEF
jgi:hypothetical protein